MWQTFQDTTSETDCDKTSETDFKTVSFNPQNDCGLGTLSYDFAHTINETFKWLAQLPTLMQNHSGGDRVASSC